LANRSVVGRGKKEIMVQIFGPKRVKIINVDNNLCIDQGDLPVFDHIVIEMII
jgi:hypothetical protein